MPHYWIDIIHKTVKPSYLEKLQIIQNINKVGETYFQNILPVKITGGLHSMHFLGM